MHPFPHHYTVRSRIQPDTGSQLLGDGLTTIDSEPPVELGGSGTHWSPETLMTAAIADCLILNFQAIARASKFQWLSLEAETRGTLEQSGGIMRFTQFTTHARLSLSPGSDFERGKRLLEKADSSCPISNSLLTSRHLSIDISDT
jgi:organic hydroperoxide reductase OsmC/OhrA